MSTYIAIDGGTTSTRVNLLQDGEVTDTIRLNIGARASIENRDEYRDATHHKAEYNRYVFDCIKEDKNRLTKENYQEEINKVYEMTKDARAEQERKTTEKAYKTVFNDADSFEEVKLDEKAVKECLNV